MVIQQLDEGKSERTKPRFYSPNSSHQSPNPNPCFDFYFWRETDARTFLFINYLYYVYIYMLYIAWYIIYSP